MLGKRVDMAILGGGVSALSLGYYLTKSGSSVAIFERSEKLGGYISRARIAGIDLDTGAESFAINRPEAIDLISDLGLADLIRSPHRSDAKLLVEGKFVDIPIGVMGIPADLDSNALLQLLSQAEIDQAKVLDSRPWGSEMEDLKSIGAIVEARLGKAIVDRAVSPVLSGVHASDAYSLEMNSVLPGLMTKSREAGSLIGGVRALRANAKPGASVAGLEGGVYQLILGLEEKIKEMGGEIYLSADVNILRVDAEWIIESGGEVFRARELALALPIDQVQRYLSHYPAIIRLLNEIVRVDIAVVVAVVESPQLSEEPLGSGVLIQEGQSDVHAKASTHASAKWGWLRARVGKERDVIRLSYGRGGSLPEDLAILRQWAESDLRLLYGARELTIHSLEIIPYFQSLIQARVGHCELLKNIEDELSKIPNVHLLGSFMGGNGIAGNIGTAKRIAEKLVTQVNSQPNNEGVYYEQ